MGGRHSRTLKRSSIPGIQPLKFAVALESLDSFYQRFYREIPHEYLTYPDLTKDSDLSRSRHVTEPADKNCTDREDWHTQSGLYCQRSVNELLI